MASKGLRAAARALDATAEVFLVVVVLMVFGDSHRLFTSVFLALAAVCAYEALGTIWLGASVGKRLVGLRLVTLDHRGRADPAAALRRGAVSALLTVVPPLLAIAGLALVATSGAKDHDASGSQAAGGLLLLSLGIGAVAVWIGGTVGDALGRGFADRAAGTMVTPDRYLGTVSTRDLPGYADAARAPRLVPQGRVGDLDVRARARLRRLYDSRLLAGAIGLLALAVSLPFSTAETVLASSAAWIVMFVAHETWLVHTTGTTPGHSMAGLVIISRRTAAPPRRARSAARAVVLGLTLYVPLLWPVLAVSLLMMRFGDTGRGLHDLAGGTVVVSDPSLTPEAQRQRAMRLRLGRAG